MSISGVTCPASYKDTMHLPEGDRIKEARAFYVTSVNELKVSRNDPSPATSDQIKYQGKKFDIHQVKNYGDYGYFKAIGLRTAGD